MTLSGSVLPDVTEKNKYSECSKYAPKKAKLSPSIALGKGEKPTYYTPQFHLSFKPQLKF